MSQKVFPVRVRLSRAAGFNLQRASLAANTLYAINCARPSLFGNPFVVGGRYARTQEEAVELFTAWLDGEMPVFGDEKRRDRILMNLWRLKFNNAACWCASDAPCHCDVLLKAARRI